LIKNKSIHASKKYHSQNLKDFICSIITTLQDVYIRLSLVLLYRTIARIWVSTTTTMVIEFMAEK